MAWNTKKWGDRITEVMTSIGSFTSDDFSFDVTTQLQAKLDALSATQTKTLSNSLHLSKQSTPNWRKWVRAYVFIEQLLVAPLVRRTVVAIVNHFTGTPEATVRSDLRGLVRALDTWPDWGTGDLGVVRPLKIGCSVSGEPATGPGSIACFVTDNATGDVMLLTNQHVALQHLGAATGTALPDILQPARMNGGTPGNKVGKYVRGFLDARMDAAVCKLDIGIAWRNETRAGGTQPSITIVGVDRNLPRVGDIVWKCGCMSYMTRGRVKSVTKNATVPHAKFGGGIAFTNQIEVETLVAGREFQIPGDSGSALLNTNNEIIGLMHGGLKGGGVASPIDDVLTRLNVTFA